MRSSHFTIYREHAHRHAAHGTEGESNTLASTDSTPNSHALVLADPAPSLAQGADAVGFVEVDVRLVTPREGDDAGEVNHLALHAVDTLNLCVCLGGMLFY